MKWKKHRLEILFWLSQKLFTNFHAHEKINFFNRHEVESLFNVWLFFGGAGRVTLLGLAGFRCNSNHKWRCCNWNLLFKSGPESFKSYVIKVKFTHVLTQKHTNPRTYVLYLRIHLGPLWAFEVKDPFHPVRPKLMASLRYWILLLNAWTRAGRRLT